MLIFLIHETVGLVNTGRLAGRGSFSEDRGVTAAVWKRLALLLLMLAAGAGAVVWLARGPEAVRLADHLEPVDLESQGGRFAAFAPDHALSGPVTLGGETHPSLTPPLPATLDFDVRVPADAALQFSVGIQSEREVSRAKVELEVAVESEGERTIVYREVFRSFQMNRWYPRRVDLSAWSAKAARLSLHTRPAFGIESAPWADRIRVAWGNPVVTRREARPAAARSLGSHTGERPSILLVLVDTLRADYLGSYGFEGDVSPALDRLAAESLRFANCFSQAPWTKPSVATLFTSLYPEVHGLTNHEGLFWGPEQAEMKTGVMPEEAFTLAEALRERGYRTAGFMTNPMLAPTYGFDQGFETYQFYEVQDLSNPVMDAAYNWLDALPAGQPFFAYLHLMDVHGPYDAPREDFDALRDSPSLGSPYHLTEEEVDGISGYLKRIPWAQTEEARELLNWRAHYAAGIRDFDRRFSSFIERLRTSGRLDQTYLVLTSDHGDELFEHRGWDHGHSLFDHQLHVPLFIRRPHGEGARVVENVVSIIDIMPTLLSIAGIEPPASLQGRNLSRLFAASFTDSPDDNDDNEVSHGTATSDRPGLHAVRTRRHKLIFDLDTGETRLFDVESDPGEQENLADQRTEIVRRLRDQLLTQVAESTAQGALEKRTAPVPDELVEQLRTLGYVQ